jgi:hypothetical protein
MKTSDLIHALQSDAARPPMPLMRSWWLAVMAGTLAAAVVFALVLHPRADFWAVIGSPRFLFKFAVSATLAAAAFAALRALSRPEARLTPLLPLMAAPLLLAAAVSMELLTVAPAEWAARLVGHNSMGCLASIAAMGILPLGLFILALRHGAPGHPVLAGAIAGLLSGGLAAFLYAAHCADDSPLFVATWYTIATLGLAAIGALAGRFLVRW